MPLLIGKQCFKHVLMPADFVADVIGKPFTCCHVAKKSGDVPKDLQRQQALRISFSNRQQPVVLARVPVWDLERHGCRARAYMDVLAACPTPVRVQAPSADRSIRASMKDVLHRLIGVRSRSAARRRIQCRDTP
ncbi:hypothetical protein [Xanthomonas arboricola]|uniref:hypothetical protein n=1 Tax=Xanthomonas arboricola TaxID=56448 RepID=UPI0016198707|nr:hypothetical protein [Xanthomonas arboricola]